MFYAADDIDKLLTCQNCNKRYDVPKYLPCGESICETCLNNIVMESSNSPLLTTLTSIYISCPFCKLYHEYKRALGFPTQKLLVEVLSLKPVNVNRGCIYNETKNLVHDLQDNLVNIETTLITKETIVRISCSVIREKLNQIKNLEFEQSIDEYEKECYESIKNYFNIQTCDENEFKRFINAISSKLQSLENLLNSSELTQIKFENICKIVSYLKIQVIINQNFLNSILFNRKVIAIKNDKIEYNLFYDFNDVINVERLKIEAQNLKNPSGGSSSGHPLPTAYKIINYKNHPYFNNDYLISSRKKVMQLWISILYNNYLILFLQIFNYYTDKNEVHMVLLNSNGDLINQTGLNQTHVDNLKLITLTNTNLCKLDSNFILIATEKETINFASTVYELYLYNLEFNLIKKIRVNYRPCVLFISKAYVYALSAQIPFIRQYYFSTDDKTKLLEEYKVYGQNTDSNDRFYMSNNIMQIFSRYNDELLFVCFLNSTQSIADNDVDHDGLIRVYSTNTGFVLHEIKINLLNSLIYVDSLLRVIVLNKKTKNLIIYNIVEEFDYENGEKVNENQFDNSDEKNYALESKLELVYEHDLKYVDGCVSAFCIVNGYILINDYDNKIIYII